MFCSNCDLAIPIPLEEIGHNIYQCPRCGMIRTRSLGGGFNDRSHEEYENEIVDGLKTVGKVVGTVAIGALILGAIASDSS